MSTDVGKFAKEIGRRRPRDDKRIDPEPAKPIGKAKEKKSRSRTVYSPDSHTEMESESLPRSASDRAMSIKKQIALAKQKLAQWPVWMHPPHFFDDRLCCDGQEHYYPCVLKGCNHRRYFSKHLENDRHCPNASAPERPAATRSSS